MILLRPEPCGSGKYMCSAKERGERLLRLDRRLNMWRVVLQLVGVFYFLDAFEARQLFLASGFHNFVKKVSDHLVAGRGNPDAFTLADEFADHPGSGVGLSCTRRSLNSEQ